jgi:hypothetical protein
MEEPTQFRALQLVLWKFTTKVLEFIQKLPVEDGQMLQWLLINAKDCWTLATREKI